MKTQKLINEYSDRITQLDKEIVFCTQAVSDFRNNKTSLYFFDIKDAQSTRREAQVKRQMLIQFIQDLQDRII